MWGANTDAQYILNPYATTLYCISYLTKINNLITQEMKIVLNKFKHEQTKTSEHIKKLRNIFLNAQQMSIQQVVHIIHTIIPFNKIISIYKHMSTTRLNICIITTKIIQGLFPNSTKSIVNH